MHAVCRASSGSPLGMRLCCNADAHVSRCSGLQRPLVMACRWCAGGIGNSGEARWEYFRNVVAVPSIKKTGGALRCALHLTCATTKTHISMRNPLSAS